MSCCYLCFCAYSAIITCIKQPRVSLRSTLGYVLLRLQRDNYSFDFYHSTFDLSPSTLDLTPSTFDLSPLTFDLRPHSTCATHDDAVMAHSTDEMNVRMACIMLCFCSLFSFIILFL